MANFDRAIPPGGEGTITLRLKTTGYRGRVSKGASVYSDDPNHRLTRLTLTGEVKPLIDIRPSRFIRFQGKANQVKPKTVDFISLAGPFHIKEIKTDLESKIRYELKTVKEGKHYQLIVANLVDEGNYHGWITCTTDSPTKPTLRLRIVGRIEGKITVAPATLLVGILNPKFPARSGKVYVISNEDIPFKINQLTYDKDLISVVQNPIPKRVGYVLTVTPHMAKVEKGKRQKTSLTVQTSLEPNHKHRVIVYLVNR